MGNRLVLHKAQSRVEVEQFGDSDISSESCICNGDNLVNRSQIQLIQNPEENTSLTHTYSNAINILDLPNELLLYIYKFLPLNDRIILAKTDNRLFQIFQNYMKSSRILTTDICDERISNNLIYEIIKKNRKYIEIFRICSRDNIYNWNDIDRAISSVLFEATYLRTLYLDFRYQLEYEEFFADYALTLRKLENLTIRNSVICDNSLSELATIKTIKHLDLTNNSIIRGGNYFRKFKKLENLILNKCTNLQPHVLLLVTQNCKKLKTLDIRIDSLDVYLLLDFKYEYIFKNLKKLENLAIIDVIVTKRQNPSIITKNLLKLKTLIYTVYSTDGDPNRNKMYSLLNETGQNLIKLKIQFRFYESIDIQFYKQLECMKNLKVFHLSGIEYCHRQFKWLNLIEFNTNLELLNVSVYHDEFIYQKNLKHDFFEFLTAKRNENFKNLVIKILDFNRDFFVDMLMYIYGSTINYTHKITIECSLKDHELKKIETHPVYLKAKHLIRFMPQKYDCYWPCDDLLSFDALW